ncbi:MAG TPA: carbonic anhydrase [Jatrophihabitans sp.]|nr:carbonic anhydrase [Jatrophihabitans sp.]
MTLFDELLAANAGYLADRTPDDSPAAPSRRLAVVTCMDARLDVLGALGLELGQAHVLRNAGGIVTSDVLRSLAISQRALGTNSIAIIQHTLCGMSGFDDAAFRSELASTGELPDWDVPGFDDVHHSVRQSVERVRSSSWLPERGLVAGFVFDVRTGEITRAD